jgi:hypothetical protein
MTLHVFPSDIQSLASCSNDIIFTNPPIVMTVYSKGDGQWHQPGPADQSPEKQVPVIVTFFAPNTEPKTGPEERKDTLAVHRPCDTRGLQFFQKIPDSQIEVMGRIDLFHN